MSARVHVILGGAGAGKTTHLLHRYHEVARGQPRSALWLGPTRRGIEEVRGRLAAQSGALLGCLLYTFQEFVEEIVRVHEPATRPLSHVQRRLLLEEVISDLVHREDLQPFAPVLETRGFIEGLLTLLVGLKRVEITPLTFARAAYRRGAGTVHPARQIAEWGITPKDRACARIFARYEQALRQQGLLDVEGQVVRAASLLRQGAHGPGGPLARVQAVFLDGFITFTPSQQEILEALRSRVSEMWIALPDEPGNERSELFARPRATFAFLQRESAEEEGAQGHVCCHRLGERVPPAPLPEGLVHLEKQLFRPLRRVEVGTNAEGICCLEAPGVLGEARMVARRIKELLLEGVTPEEIVVTMREVGPYVDRLQEVFEEYGISVDIEGHESLLHAPPVALLLRALRLPEDDWPFAGVTALLRNNYCMPRWPENAADPEMLDKTEALLRLLGEPRGREAYLAAARRWAERQQEGLEDEDAEEARRRRTHELAKHCLAFLERFLQSWDRMPVRAPVANHRDWLVAFAREMGIDEMARVDPRDALALDTLWQELDRWCRRDQESIRAGSVSDGSSGSVSDGPSLLDRHTFFHRLTALAGEAGIPRTLATGGKARSAHVRVLSAELSRHLSVPYLFVMGLGEGSFPQLAGPLTLIDDQERQAFSQSGLDLPGSTDLMPEEMLLFYQMVTGARRQLVLSYPAVDERGQDLLPSSFLLTLLDCFAPGVVPVERRRMLLEGHDQERPLSLAEYRVRLASQGIEGVAEIAASPGLHQDLLENLRDAAVLLQRRFRDPEHNAYDGRLAHPAVVAQVANKFGPTRIFSPTALEDYVSCPFRFYLRHVLRLDPLEEPREEIEVTRRGQAVHRALARVHRKRKQRGVDQVEEISPEVIQEFGEAIAEDIHRAPSPASKELWRLEGQRLLRVAQRYSGQWQKFVKPWQERQVFPTPYYFEIDFGLPGAEEQPGYAPLILQSEEGEVRISGRVDRVDLAELRPGSEAGDDQDSPPPMGFWIIDYKTGRASHYTSTDLTEFRRLQLTLYALAVEQVLLADRHARPLGLAYWLVTDGGAKVVLPSRNQTLWLEETGRWQTLRKQLEQWILTLVHHIRVGAFPLAPRSDNCTQICPYGQVCRITQARSVGKEWSLPLPVIPSP